MTTTADRVLLVLDLFRGEQPEWSVEQAADRMDLPVSTVYRYFKSLSNAGLIYSYVPGLYVLGPAIVQLDWQIRRTDPLIAVSREEMTGLARHYGERCVVLLARLYDRGVMCVDQVTAGKPPFATGYERGRVMPINRGATSKVILANLGPRQRSLLELDADGLVALRTELRTIRARGYAVTRGELDVGLCGIAVPIFAQNQLVYASLSVVVSDEIVDVTPVVEHLIMARKQIEARLAILFMGQDRPSQMA
jgi:DNA-binding IclR family transcriptional regulator